MIRSVVVQNSVEGHLDMYLATGETRRFAPRYRTKWLFCFLPSTCSKTGGLTSINSVLSKKRYWWESVCNTAYISGEDSADDTNGCRVLTSAMGVC